MTGRTLADIGRIDSHTSHGSYRLCMGWTPRRVRRYHENVVFEGPEVLGGHEAQGLP